MYSQSQMSAQKEKMCIERRKPNTTALCFYNSTSQVYHRSRVSFNCNEFKTPLQASLVAVFLSVEPLYSY